MDTMPTIKIQDQEVVIVEKNLFNDLLHRISSSVRESKRKGICSKKEALEILGCGSSTFYRMLKNPKCKIRKSSVNGKFIISSLDDEMNRLNKTR